MVSLSTPGSGRVKDTREEAVPKQQMECGSDTCGGFQPTHLHWGPGTRLGAGGVGQMTLDKPLSLQFMSDEVLAIT